jgi:hypothetical protein
MILNKHQSLLPFTPHLIVDDVTKRTGVTDADTLRVSPNEGILFGCDSQAFNYVVHAVQCAQSRELGAILRLHLINFVFSHFKTFYNCIHNHI